MLRSKNVPICKWQVCLLALCLQPVTLLADTIVNVQSNLGEFKLELFEDLAPATVAHFLANIEAGTYQFTMIHEVTGIFLTSGLYFYNSCSEGPVLAPMLASIPVENSGLSNTPRTIAMVPNPDDPTTVGGQWVINVGNNEPVFGSARPVVFGEVIEGLPTVEDILDSWRVPMDVSLSVPTVNYEGILSVQCGVFNRDNVIKVAMQVESVDPVAGNQAANVFDTDSGMLNINVDAGSAGLLALSLLLQSTEPDVVLQAQPETVVVLAEAVEGMATFDAATNELTIPELVIDEQVAFTNLVFLLTDLDNLFFTLQSFDTP